MASTSITTVGGVTVVTQVISQDKNAIPLQTAAKEAPPPATQAPPTTVTASKMDDMTAVFLRGEPRVLGVVQIFIGLLCLSFSLTAVFSDVFIVHAPLCLAVTFLLSGSVTTAAARRTSVAGVCVSLACNLASVLLALGGVAYVCWLLAGRRPSQRFCDPETSESFAPSETLRLRCVEQMDRLDVVVFGCLGVLLVLLVLQVCVSVTVSVFSIRAIRRRRLPFMVAGDDGGPLLCDAAAKLDSDVALLDSEGEKCCTPENSP